MNEALVLLVLVWAVLLVPSALRSRKASPHATVGGFERAMSVLRSDAALRGGGRQVMVPEDARRIVHHEIRRDVAAPAYGQAAEGGAPYAPTGRAAPEGGDPPGADPPPTGPPSGARGESPVVVRRRVRFVRLLIATLGTLALALVAGGWSWTLFVAVLAMTVGYTVLLRRIKVQRDEARRVVAELDLHREPLSEPVRAAAGDGWGSGNVRLRRWDD